MASNIESEEPIRGAEIIDDRLYTYNRSETIQRATCNVLHDAIFNFCPTTMKEVDNLLNRTDPTKATGYDDIPLKLLKMWATELVPTITIWKISRLKNVVFQLH